MTNGFLSAATAVLTIPALAERPFLGGGCCGVEAAGLLRRELERWPAVASVVIDAKAGEVTLTLADPSVDLEPVYEMLEDLDYPAERTR